MKKLMMMTIMTIMCIFLASCGEKKDDKEGNAKALDASATDADLSQYKELDGVYFLEGDYHYECNNMGTLVYFTNGQKESMSICVKKNENMTYDEIIEMYDMEISGFYGRNNKIEEYETYDMTWRVYSYMDGINSNENQLVKGYLYTDGDIIIYIENTADKKYGLSKKVERLIDSIIIK